MADLIILLNQRVSVGFRAPIAVGHAAMSSGDMLAAGMCGKGVIIDHICGDHLWY